MDRKRDIQDYELLASVRERRNEGLQEAVRLARAEHAYGLTRQSASETALRASLQTQDAYSARLRARTAVGQNVRLGELDNARSHGLALQTSAESAYEACRQAASAVDSALAKYQSASRHLANNEARIRSLIEQANRWRRAAQLEAEKQEEDERNDAGSVRP